MEYVLPARQNRIIISPVRQTRDCLSGSTPAEMVSKILSRVCGLLAKNETVHPNWNAIGGKSRKELRWFTSWRVERTVCPRGRTSALVNVGIPNGDGIVFQRVLGRVHLDRATMISCCGLLTSKHKGLVDVAGKTLTPPTTQVS